MLIKYFNCEDTNVATRYALQFFEHDDMLRGKPKAGVSSLNKTTKNRKNKFRVVLRTTFAIEQLIIFIRFMVILFLIPMLTLKKQL
jgi:hypothetical protein